MPDDVCVVAYIWADGKELYKQFIGESSAACKDAEKWLDELGGNDELWDAEDIVAYYVKGKVCNERTIKLLKATK